MSRGLRWRDKRTIIPKYLYAVSAMPSVISGMSPCQVCHIRYADARLDKRMTGMGEKPSDCWVLPMTPAEHTTQHQMNERKFWQDLGIDATQAAYDLYRAWLKFGEDEMKIVINKILLR